MQSRPQVFLDGRDQRCREGRASTAPASECGDTDSNSEKRFPTLRIPKVWWRSKNRLIKGPSFSGSYSYRRRIACDAEERQRFSKKIIVLILTIDAIELSNLRTTLFLHYFGDLSSNWGFVIATLCRCLGADLMVRAARRSMLDELEAMLDVVQWWIPSLRES
ncbi:hypothetical protein NE237_028158 [Protea cynaroides]|uniref:Uncharacterized protein n=1 Tax=Protea cynaroides TaxID=273540 RepID=A0A9Q0GQM8_9MAGN|nr:hypothetical protein NE237_028158 [Protea cynaroides]